MEKAWILDCWSIKIGFASGILRVWSECLYSVKFEKCALIVLFVIRFLQIAVLSDPSNCSMINKPVWAGDHFPAVTVLTR